MRLHHVALLFFGLALFPVRTEACFCAPSPVTACEDNLRTEVVFIGRVTFVRRAAVRERPDEPLRQAHMSILESFRGISEHDVDIFTSATDCGIDFKAQSEYLVYAWRDQGSGRLGTSACARTAPVDSAAENIANLRQLTSGRGPARVFGFVTGDPDDLQMPFRSSKPLAGIPILLRLGEQSWRTVTDERGDYEFTQLPAGFYEGRADLPNADEEQRHRNFRLLAGACSRQNFLAVPVARIEGRLVDSDNRPVPNVLVEIDGIPPTNQPHPILRPLTDANGKFYYDNLEIGEYILGVNLTTPPFAHDWYDKRSPLARSYYPGVADRSQAAVVTLERGRNREDLTIHLPPSPRTLPFNGQVALDNGSPVRALVSLFDLDYPGEAAQVDTVLSGIDGRFVIQGVEGRRYGIFAKAGRGGQIRYSNMLELGDNNTPPLRLVLSHDARSEPCKVCAHYKIWQSPLWNTPR